MADEAVPTPTIEDVQAKRNELFKALDAETQERSRKCGAEVDLILKKYNCILGVKLDMTDDGRVKAMPLILAR